MSERAERLVQAYLENAREIERLETQLQAAETALDSIADKRLQRVLELRYMDGKTWDEVAACLGYDVRWIMRLHRKALTALRLAK